MDPEGYRRLNAAFCPLAEQSNIPDVQLRWVALAQESSSVAMDPPLKLRAWSTEETENARVAFIAESARKCVEMSQRSEAGFGNLPGYRSPH
jgi:hypothetical protein